MKFTLYIYVLTITINVVQLSQLSNYCSPLSYTHTTHTHVHTYTHTTLTRNCSAQISGPPSLPPMGASLQLESAIPPKSLALQYCCLCVYTSTSQALYNCQFVLSSPSLPQTELSYRSQEVKPQVGSCEGSTTAISVTHYMQLYCSCNQERVPSFRGHKRVMWRQNDATK